MKQITQIFSEGESPTLKILKRRKLQKLRKHGKAMTQSLPWGSQMNDNTSINYYGNFNLHFTTSLCHLHAYLEVLFCEIHNFT